MPKQSKVYSSDQVVFSFAGQNIDSGRGEEAGEFIKIEQQEDDFGYQSSTDGFGTFFKKNNRLTNVTVTLAKTSPGNDVLMAIHLASMGLNGAPSPVYCADTGGNAKFVSDAGLISKTPDETYAEEPGTNVWVLLVHDPLRFVGGH